MENNLYTKATDIIKMLSKDFDAGVSFSPEDKTKSRLIVKLTNSKDEGCISFIPLKRFESEDYLRGLLDALAIFLAGNHGDGTVISEHEAFQYIVQPEVEAMFQAPSDEEIMKAIEEAQAKLGMSEETVQEEGADNE